MQELLQKYGNMGEADGGMVVVEEEDDDELPEAATGTNSNKIGVPANAGQP